MQTEGSAPAGQAISDESADASPSRSSVCQKPSRWSVGLALVTLAGLVLRVIYALTLASNHNAPLAHGDFDFFRATASLLAAGHGFVHPFPYPITHQFVPTAEHPPLWPLVLSLGDRLGATGLPEQRLITALIGSGAIAAIGVLAKQLAGARAGLIAAGIAAVYPVLIASDGSVMSESLDGLLLAVAVIAAYRVRSTSSVRAALACGVLIGLATLTRSEGIVMPVFLLLPALWRRPSRRWVTVAVAVSGALLVMLPWTLRNADRLNAVVVTSTNDGTLLRGANCPGTYAGELIGFWEVTCLTPPYQQPEATRSARWRREGLTFAGDHLSRLPVVLGVRLLRTLGLYQPFYMTQYAEGENVTMAKLGVLAFYAVAALAIFGLLQLRRRRVPLFGLWALIGLSLMITLGGYGYPRFRHPAEIALVIGAAVAVEEILVRTAVLRLTQDSAAG
jgi:dolichyl-phosphate-mannose-protein mannosyltransferase